MTNNLNKPIENKEDIECAFRFILSHFDNVQREGLLETPKRYIKFLEEFMNPKPFNMTVFDSEGYNEMIIVKDISFYSLCEHHILPFWGVAHVAYIPDKHIVGLSKIARTVEMFSRRLQNQERITQQISEYLTEKLKPKGVAVVLNARHMCMEMRGVKKHGSNTITSKLTGGFFYNTETRLEFFNNITV